MKSKYKVGDVVRCINEVKHVTIRKIYFDEWSCFYDIEYRDFGIVHRVPESGLVEV